MVTPRTFSRVRNSNSCSCSRIAMLMVRASTLTTRVGRSASAAPKAAGIGGIKRQRFFQPETDHGFRLIALRGERFEIEEHDAHRGIGQNRDHVLRSRPDGAERAFNRLPDSRAVAQIGFHPRWHPWRE